MQGTTVVYVALCCSLISIGGLILLVPLLTTTLDDLQRDFNADFQEVKGMTENMWQDLMLLRKDIPLGLERKIRQAGYGEYAKPHSYGKPPSYGYGYTKLKCCCAIEGASAGAFQYQGGPPAHPTSYKCPAGYHGPPGPEGEGGVPGVPGTPGFPGEDYPNPPGINTAATRGYPSAALPQGVGPGGLGYGTGDFRGGEGGVFGYSDYRPASNEYYCEPCPPGPPGHYGPKGRPGLHGKKGVPGPGGIPGKPRHAGRPGYPGEPGHRGLPGVIGPQGRSGADGFRGGKGLPGAKGEAGGKGVYGAVGAPGLNGPPGSYGPPGRPGPLGPKGHYGPQGSPGAQGAPGSPGKDAHYCPCPNRGDETGYRRPPPATQTGYGSNSGRYTGINPASTGGGNYGVNGFNAPTPYNAYTGASNGPAATRSPFIIYSPAESNPSSQRFPQPTDSVFGPASPSVTPFPSRSPKSSESLPSDSFENEEARRFAPHSLGDKGRSAVVAGAKPQNRAFVPLDALATSSSSKGEANIPAGVFSAKTLLPAYPQKLPIIKPLATSGPLYRARTIDTSPKSTFGWQGTTPFVANGQRFDERVLSRFNRRRQA